MRPSRKIVLLNVILAFAATPVTRAQTNLILNPSFEAPVVGSGVITHATPENWSFAGSSDYIVSNGSGTSFLPATDGSQLFYFFSGSLSQGGIGLTSGRSYQFTFDLSKFTTLPSGTVIATFGDGGDSHTQNFSVSSNAWTSETWDFTATDTAAYTLTLQAGADSYPAIDNLSLTEYSAVPEPAEYAVAVGLVALFVGIASRQNSPNIDQPER